MPRTDPHGIAVSVAVGDARCDVHVLEYGSASVLGAVDALAPDEIARAARFAHEDDRDRFVARRSFARSVLAMHLGAPMGSIRFVLGAHGKPALAPISATSPPLHFSLSATQRHAVLAVSAEPVGIDIEEYRTGVWDPGAAALVLSADELAWIREQPDRDDAFLRCWTRKEALAKRDGTGLFDGIETMSITPESTVDHTVLCDLTCVEASLVAVAITTRASGR